MQILISLSSDSIARAIERVFKDPVFWDILGKESVAQAGPFDGGCLICARALLLAFKNGKLVHIARSGQAEHYGVEFDGRIYDFYGAHKNADDWITTFGKKEFLPATSCVVKYGLGKPGEIPDDPAAAKHIADLLKAL